jgi:hypothetical protein
VPPAEVHQAQLSARAAQNTKDWQARYAIRAGVEGTIRQGVAACGMRRARYRGLPKTRLEHVYSAVALNLIRLDARSIGPSASRTRPSRGRPPSSSSSPRTSTSTVGHRRRVHHLLTAMTGTTG